VYVGEVADCIVYRQFWKASHVQNCRKK
jgi:hypothetical protein